MKILIVEDDLKIGNSLTKGLKAEGYEITFISNGDTAIDESNKFYDLALIDIMLPGSSGIEVAKNLKENNPASKIIFLTAKSTLEDKLTGFETGGDDYITKPFSYEELLARIKAVLKRNIENNKLIYKNVILDLGNNTAKIQEKNVELSKKEFELLKFLIINKNKVFSKDELIEKVWGYDSEILPNTVEVFIKSLRNKIEKPFNNQKIIETIRGFGYTIKND